MYWVSHTYAYIKSLLYNFCWINFKKTLSLFKETLHKKIISKEYLKHFSISVLFLSTPAARPANTGEYVLSVHLKTGNVFEK